MNFNLGIELNKDLLNLVSNKRVALIGPASYLQNKGWGKIFDDYDIVIRPNEIIPQKNMRNDYGHKTDIMFCNFGTPWMPGIKRKIKSEDREEHLSNMKLVVCSAIKASHEDQNYLNWGDDHVSDVVSNFDSINKYNLPFYWIGVRDYKKMHNFVNVEVNTGIAAILMLMHYPFKELLISGFTFYMDGRQYDDLYCPGHMDEIDTRGRTFGHGEHAKSKQLECFKNILISNSHRIKIDTYMNILLELRYFNTLRVN